MVFLLLVGVVSYGHYPTDSRCVFSTASNLPATNHTPKSPCFFGINTSLTGKPLTAGLPHVAPAPAKPGSFTQLVRDRTNKVSNRLKLSQISFGVLSAKNLNYYFLGNSIIEFALISGSVRTVKHENVFKRLKPCEL